MTFRKKWKKLISFKERKKKKKSVIKLKKIEKLKNCRHSKNHKGSQIHPDNLWPVCSVVIFQLRNFSRKSRHSELAYNKLCLL